MAQEPVRNAAPQAAWVRDNIRQFFPTLGVPNGPALDAYLIHDAQLRVYQGTLTQPGREAIGATDLKRVFAAYDRERDGWGMVDRRDLKGLVRDNVRVFWLHHDPQPQDTMPSIEERLNATMEQVQHTLEHARQMQPDMNATRARLDSVRSDLTARLEQMRENEFVGALKDLARASEPAAFAGNRSAVAVIVDADKHLIAHASGSRQAENESCSDVLTRLLPAYKSVRFPTSGCILVADNQSQVIVYWGQLPRQ